MTKVAPKITVRERKTLSLLMNVNCEDTTHEFVWYNMAFSEQSLLRRSNCTALENFSNRLKIHRTAGESLAFLCFMPHVALAIGYQAR
jgi:hypothetical protein